MPKQKKTLPDLRSMISATTGPIDGTAEATPEQAHHEDSQAALTTDGTYQETAEPENQETKKPRNRVTGNNKSRRAAEPQNQENEDAAEANATPDASASPPNSEHISVPDTEATVPQLTPRLPAVQVCVWIAPEVAGMIDSARGALATRLPKRPTRSRLVEAVLRKGLADVDALAELLWSHPVDVDEGRNDD